MQTFKINDDYLVYPDANIIGSTVKVEPRLMKLLCLLAANPNGLVTREEIVEKIWNGYGGGDEGLTQAISNLRKALNDTNKVIIETVPKSGYIFRGRIGVIDEPVTVPPSSPSTAGHLSYKIAGIIAVVMILVFGIILYAFLSRADVAPTPQPAKNPTEQNAPQAPK